jgi:hypothetical protein
MGLLMFPYCMTHNRHCEQREAIQPAGVRFWIASASPRNDGYGKRHAL